MCSCVLVGLSFSMLSRMVMWCLWIMLFCLLCGWICVKMLRVVVSEVGFVLKVLLISVIIVVLLLGLSMRCLWVLCFLGGI